MRKSRVRVIKKYVVALRLKPAQQARAFKILKRAKAKANMLANIPKSPPPISKKIYAKENVIDFKSRRKVCNKRRREKEKGFTRPQSRRQAMSRELILT